MKNAVLYFSRSGNSKRVAEKIAKDLGVNTIEITDDKNWNGVFGYLKGGYYASADKSVDIKVDGEINDVDQYIVVSPLWAGGPAPAVRQFIKKVDAKKVNLVITCNGSDAVGALKKYESKVGKLKSSFGIVRRLHNEEDTIRKIIEAAK